MIGKNIRYIRQAKGISQWQLSQAVGLTPGAIFLVEHGAKKCSPELIKAIASALGVEESELYGGKQ